MSRPVPLKDQKNYLMMVMEYFFEQYEKRGLHLLFDRSPIEDNDYDFFGILTKELYDRLEVFYDCLDWFGITSSNVGEHCMFNVPYITLMEWLQGSKESWEEYGVTEKKLETELSVKTFDSYVDAIPQYASDISVEYPCTRLEEVFDECWEFFIIAGLNNRTLPTKINKR